MATCRGQELISIRSYLLEFYRKHAGTAPPGFRFFNDYIICGLSRWLD
ncbi:hypothetical protein [Methanoregula sp.]